MSSVLINLFLAFSFSLLGLFTYRTHLMSSLLCLEGMMLVMFIMTSILMLNLNFIMMSIMPIIMLVFAACEAALGLSLLVMVSNTYGLDYVQNLNLLQC
nr:NADH dehydrogenase subunit 4L [Micropotamogale ruwenzorii]